MNKERSNQRTSKLSLRKLPVLALDCQATHNNPSFGHLAEIGWVETLATPDFDHELTTEKVKSHLVKLERHFQAPRQFFRITGIKPEEMREAVSKRDIWDKLDRAAKSTATHNQGICPAVIHFSRYEEPYLQQLYQEFAPEHGFPFKIICTHRIVSKLHPGLPRKGLRAVAGFFGYSLSNLRRCLHHVVATAFIWNHVVRILEDKEKITTLAELLDWLGGPAPSLSKQCDREYPMKKALRQNLPDKPGIYKMYRSSGDLLYIGKAKSLKYRVNSYFHKRGRHAEHILEMLSQARSLSTTVTSTALEAAVRESDEIKRLSPPYNRALQPYERQLLYHSKNLKSSHTKPNIQYPVGPIPSNIKMRSLAKLIDTMNGKIRKFSPQLIEDLLDTSEKYAPEKECFISGLEAFRREYCAPLQNPITPNYVMKWGTQFWQEKLIEKEYEKTIEDQKINQEEDEREEIEEGWTPERTFRALKRLIRIGSFQIRRARWYCRLSESVLSWPNTGNNRNDRNMLLIAKGVPSFDSFDNRKDCLDPPTGHKKTLLERQANFDLAAYDRMRIVTMEMRRLIHDGRDIELCFHPEKTLSNEQLKKILKWV
jgi:DNA polymerase-3 subunit epsilon